MVKQRIIYFSLFSITIGLGLMSKKFNLYLPDWLNLYLGDSLWGLMIFFAISFILVSYSLKKIVLLSLVVCYTVEFSQLYHANWIDKIRNTRVGHLILGNVFVWSDLVAYTLGIILGMIISLSLKGYLNYSQK